MLGGGKPAAIASVWNRFRLGRVSPRSFFAQSWFLRRHSGRSPDQWPDRRHHRAPAKFARISYRPALIIVAIQIVSLEVSGLLDDAKDSGIHPRLDPNPGKQMKRASPRRRSRFLSARVNDDRGKFRRNS
jgi:hypothetical protein